MSLGGVGGTGRMPARLSSQRTLSVGCAPTASQYLRRQQHAPLRALHCLHLGGGSGCCCSCGGAWVLSGAAPQAPSCIEERAGTQERSCCGSLDPVNSEADVLVAINGCEGRGKGQLTAAGRRPPGRAVRCSRSRRRPGRRAGRHRTRPLLQLLAAAKQVCAPGMGSK
jgi:hypothetical protein